jgi:mono/diheme cytochrome c family protein
LSFAILLLTLWDTDLTTRTIAFVELFTICVALTSLQAKEMTAQTSHSQATLAARNGQRVFAQSCASCHDVRSRNQLAGPGLKGYYTTHRPVPKDDDVRNIIMHGKGSMPSFGSLSSVEIDDLVVYLKTL